MYNLLRPLLIVLIGLGLANTSAAQQPSVSETSIVGDAFTCDTWEPEVALNDFLDFTNVDMTLNGDEIILAMEFVSHSFFSHSRSQ